jgi:D-alanyl-D-alanine endopeptidase (penicillin-binding protein 7)
VPAKAERAVRGGKNVVNDPQAERQDGRGGAAAVPSCAWPSRHACPTASSPACTAPATTSTCVQRVLVIDQDTREVLFSKNDRGAAHRVAHQAHDRPAGQRSQAADGRTDHHHQDDVDTEKGSSSRLRVGTTLSRGELLHLALMSSENRAAHALGRTYPGGLRPS